MKTVLIVEDEKMIRQGLRTMIQRSGVPVETVLECSNGEAALAVLQSQKVDVMFTDIRMPKMNGIELVQKVQELPEKPVIVAVSGYAEFSYAVEMLRTGAREYLLKPIEREKLWEILRSLEDEISRDQENSRTSWQLGHQQLKYLMMNGQITEEELDAMQTEYESALELRDYYVCARNPEEPGRTDEDGYIWLHNVEGFDVYLVQERNVQRLLQEELAEVYVGISSLHSGIRELRTAWREAVRARQQAFCTDRKTVYASQTGRNVPEEFCRQGQKLTGEEAGRQRVQMIGGDKTEDLVKAWNRFFYAVKNEWIMPADFTKCMDGFFSEVRKTYRNAVADGEDDLRRLEDYYSYAALSVWQAQFMDWLLNLHERVRSSYETSKNKQKIKQATEYIMQNYDKELNMAVVSNHISMNYSMFSQLFKEYTGSNFVNYLREIRMAEAKRLLEETDLQINEISVKVGYDNEKHFMKIFKASYGISPGKWRKNTQRPLGSREE